MSGLIVCTGCNGRGWVLDQGQQWARACRRCGGPGKLSVRFVANLIGERDARIVERLNEGRVRASTAARLCGPLARIEEMPP